MPRKSKKPVRKQTHSPTGKVVGQVGQILLPMIAGIAATKADLTEWVYEQGLTALHLLLREDAEEIAGLKGRCFRCLLLVICTYPFAKEALTLHLARGEGHKRYFDCNLMHCKVLASSHQHLMAEAPSVFATGPIKGPPMRLLHHYYSRHPGHQRGNCPAQQASGQAPSR